MRSLPNIIKDAGDGGHIRSYTFMSDFSVENREPDRMPDADYPDTVGIFEDALAQAEELLAKAKESAEEIRKAAREEGYDEGYKKGYEDGHQKAYTDHKIKLDYEMERFETEFTEAIEGVTETKEQVLDKYLDDLKRVSLAIAEKVIQTSLKSSSEVVKRMILAATSKLKKTQWAKIYITKNSLGSLVQADAELLRELTHLSDNIKIIAMESEEEGTCIIELPEEVIDASVSTQLENIRDILNNARL